MSNPKKPQLNKSKHKRLVTQAEEKILDMADVSDHLLKAMQGMRASASAKYDVLFEHLAVLTTHLNELNTINHEQQTLIYDAPTPVEPEAIIDVKDRIEALEKFLPDNLTLSN